jgi:SAM-dependent methyltransferase
MTSKVATSDKDALEASPNLPVLVLTGKEEAASAREWIRRNRLDAQKLFWVRFAYVMRNRHQLVPTFLKSWDVAHFAKLIIRELPLDAAILDIGSSDSELPWALHLAGFCNITACDVDPNVKKMPFSRKIRYRVGDFLTLRFPGDAFAAVTAVSTVEHGIDLDKFLSEAARVLRPNGLLCISTDYWPEKIDTSGIRPFAMSWKIFSVEEIRAFVRLAAGYGLILDNWNGEIPQPVEAAVDWNGKRYTFVAIIFRKNDWDSHLTD